MQVGRVLQKLRALEATPAQLEQLTNIHDEEFDVPRLLQSPLFRALLMDAVVRLESNPNGTPPRVSSLKVGADSSQRG